MSVQKAISNLNVKNNGSSILHGGNVTRNEIGSLDFGDTNMNYMRQGLVSGLTAKAISGGEFNVENRLVSLGFTTSIGGNVLTALVGAVGVEKRTQGHFPGYNRYDVESVNVLNGDILYGSNRGDFVPSSGLDGNLGAGADLNTSASYAVPSKLVYREDSGVDTKNYSPWTN